MRYAVCGNLDIAERLAFDVLIIGAGVAGLYTALNIDRHASCCILAKESVEISNSWLAQGGIAAAVSTEDTPKMHFEDTLIAGAGLCDEEAVNVLVEEGPSDIRELISFNVPFDLNDEGFLQITREGGHRINRIVHAGGDATGRETVKSLARLVATRENVVFLGNSFFVDILSGQDEAVTGALIIGEDGRFRIISCPNLVIATGGVGQVYKNSTNPSVATGDGLAATIRAGASVKGLEFIQFHPTGLWTPSSEERSFLISEAVRGEGGLLLNSKGERFMLDRHELAELAPRDIVAREITRELEQSGENHVFIDITSRSREFLARRFPTIFSECLNRGIDISKIRIPVCPVQHYLIGGISTDLEGRTDIPGLYACGEAASTGVHGANRLASNSMLECLVFGRRAAKSINGRMREAETRHEPTVPAVRARPYRGGDFFDERKEIQELMNEYCFVVRDRSNLEFALTRIKDIERGIKSVFAPIRPYFEVLNITCVARAIVESALKRGENVGAHYCSQNEL